MGRLATISTPRYAGQCRWVGRVASAEKPTDRAVSSVTSPETAEAIRRAELKRFGAAGYGDPERSRPPRAMICRRMWKRMRLAAT
jgi:hypothetical protein